MWRKMSKYWRRTVNNRQKKKESVKQLEVYIGRSRKESKAYDRKRHEFDIILTRELGESYYPGWKKGWPNRYRQRTVRKNGEWKRGKKNVFRFGGSR